MVTYCFIVLHQDSSLLVPNVTKQVTEKQTSIIIEQEDGTEKHIVLATSQTTAENGCSTGTGQCICLVEDGY